MSQLYEACSHICLKDEMVVRNEDDNVEKYKKAIEKKIIKSREDMINLVSRHESEQLRHKATMKTDYVISSVHNFIGAAISRPCLNFPHETHQQFKTSSKDSRLSQQPNAVISLDILLLRYPAIVPSLHHSSNLQF